MNNLRYGYPFRSAASSLGVYGNRSEDALRKLQYDLYYIRHQSPMLDLLIVLRTIGVILLRRT